MKIKFFTLVILSFLVTICRAKELFPPPNYGHNFSIEPLTEKNIVGWLEAYDGDDISKSVLFQNLDLLENVLNHPDPNFSVPSIRHNALNLFEFAWGEGLITQEKFFDIGLDFLVKIPTIYSGFPQPIEALRQSVSDSLTRHAGQKELNNFPTPVSESISYTSALLEKMEQHQLITNKGILNSLLVKLENALKLIVKNNPKGAVNILSALIHEINAQSGKHFNETCRATFLNILDNLIAHIESGHP